jgi:hypothetical protein
MPRRALRRWCPPRRIAVQGPHRVPRHALRRRCPPQRIAGQEPPARATSRTTPTVPPSAYRRPGAPSACHVARYADSRPLGVTGTAVRRMATSTLLRRGPVCQGENNAVRHVAVRRRPPLRQGPHRLSRGQPFPRGYAEGHRQARPKGGSRPGPKKIWGPSQVYVV